MKVGKNLTKTILFSRQKIGYKTMMKFQDISDGMSDLAAFGFPELAELLSKCLFGLTSSHNILNYQEPLIYY